MPIEQTIELREKVVKVIDQIRPYLQADGGDVEFLELTKENDVVVKLVGSCGRCPFSLMTLKNGIETAVKKALPEIRCVRTEDMDV